MTSSYSRKCGTHADERCVTFCTGQRPLWTFDKGSAKVSGAQLLGR